MDYILPVHYILPSILQMEYTLLVYLYTTRVHFTDELYFTCALY